MNITTSLKRAALVALVLGAFGAPVAFADDAATPDTATTGSTTPASGWHHKHHHHGEGVLSEAERSELKKDRDTVFASNPALKTQEETLKSQFKALKSQNPPATKEQFEALKQQHEALKSQLRTAIEGVDSGAAALFAKVDAAKAQHKHNN